MTPLDQAQAEYDEALEQLREDGSFISLCAVQAAAVALQNIEAEANALSEPE